MKTILVKFFLMNALLWSEALVAQQVGLSVENTDQLLAAESLQIEREQKDSLELPQMLKKAALINPVTAIDAKNFNRGIINDPIQLIQGKVPGMQITKAGSDPNENTIARVRGISTISAGPGPLIVIDGIIGASLQTVDPSQIGSITVLKDAASSSLYGARGANGVIIITSKAAAPGELSTSYHSSVGFQKIARTIETININEFRNINSSDFGGSPDWHELIGRTAVSHVHILSFSGGNESTAYRASLNSRNIQGVQINSGFQQWNGSLLFSQKALKNLVTFRTQIANTARTSELGVREAWRYATTNNPTMPVYGEDMQQYGGYYHLDFFDHFNPLAMIRQNRRDGKNNVLTAKIGASIDLKNLLNGLTADISLSQQSIKTEAGSYSAKNAAYGGGFSRNGLARLSTDAESNRLFDSRLNYAHSANELEFDISVGYSHQYFYNDGFSMEAGNFLTDAFSYHNMGAALDFANGIGRVNSYASSHTMISLAGRAQAAYKNTWYVSIGSNYNGSSRFGANQKWANFPSVGAAVVVSELLEIPLLNHLKARFSWGQAGNIPSSSYGSLQRFAQIGNPFYIGPAYNFYNPQVYTLSNPNPELKRELRTERNFGFDYAIFKSRVKGSFDFYNSKSSDLLFPVNVPSPPNVVGSTLLNILEIQNKGYELSLFYDQLNTAGLGWSTGLLVSGFRSRMTKMTDGDLGIDELYRGYDGCGCSQGRIRTREGEEIGQIWGPVFSKIDETGRPVLKDLNGDGYFCECSDDYAVIGTALPDFSIGFDNTIRFRNLTLNSFFRGVFGHDLINSYRTRFEHREPLPYNIVATRHFNRNITMARFSNLMVENASYFKLDNITLTYSYPLSASSALGELKLYVTAQNLFTITGYTGFDPEVRYDYPLSGGDSDQLAPGIETLDIYPTTRAYVMGLELRF